MGRLVDLTGKRFGRWTVQRRGQSDAHKMAYWVCVCECGEVREVRGTILRNGESTSCGCVSLHNANDMSRSPTYYTWLGMKARCHGLKGHKHYSARGIIVCDRWRNDFNAFLADVGEKPGPGYSIDRIDVNGNYEPGNVRWATAIEQNNNTRTTRFVMFRGERIPFQEAARRAGCFCRSHHATAWNRIKRGWDVELAFSTPPKPQRGGNFRKGEVVSRSA